MTRSQPELGGFGGRYTIFVPYAEHPVCETPKDEVVLWRYMDFVKFIALLDSSELRFTRLDQLDDPREGMLTDVELGELSSRKDDLVRSVESDRTFGYVNCWHEANHESMAMWDLYSPRLGSVAIRSSVGRIKKAIEADTSTVMIGRIQYLNWATYGAFPGNVIAMCLRKEQSYKHESEVRLVMWAPQLDLEARMEETAKGESQAINLAQLTKDFARTLGEVYPLWKYEGADLPMIMLRAINRGHAEEYVKTTPSGFGVQTRIPDLIQEVIVGPREPQWVADLVKNAMARYGVTVPVRRSTLTPRPKRDE